MKNITFGDKYVGYLEADQRPIKQITLWFHGRFAVVISDNKEMTSNKMFETRHKHGVQPNI